MKLRSIAAILALTIITAACANSSSTGPQGGGDLRYPHGSSDLVLRISTGGGFVPPNYSNGQVPGFSLFGDGRVITTGAQTEIYPQPALPPVLVATVDADGVRTIVRAALDAGLGHDASFTDLGSVGIADAPTTTFTLSANGETHTVAVYALGELASEPATMPHDEFAARTALQQLASQVADLTTLLPAGSTTDSQLYTPTEMRLFVSDHQADPTLKEPAIDWPGATPLSSFGTPVDNQPGTRCGTVTGADLATLLSLAQKANQLTPWRSDGARFSLVFRPLLPDETGC